MTKNLKYFTGVLGSKVDDLTTIRDVIHETSTDMVRTHSPLVSSSYTNCNRLLIMNVIQGASYHQTDI